MAGLNGDSSIQFVELVVQDDSQKQWGPQSGETVGRCMLVFSDAAGHQTGRFVFPGHPPAGSPTVLIATLEFSHLTGLTPDFIMPRNVMPLAGQVCFQRNPDGSTAADEIEICLSYGGASFTGNTSAAGPANGAQLSILNSQALRRTAHFDASSFGSSGQLNADFALGSPTPAGTQAGGAAADLAQNVIGQISLPGPDSQVRQGENLFLRETFLGNGRTCGTCHVPAERFSLPPIRVASLLDSDPLFINEQNVNQLVLNSFGSVNPSASSGGTQPSDLEIGGIITGTLGGSATVLSGSGNTYRIIGGGSLNIPGNVISDWKGNSGTLISFASGNLNGPTPSNTDPNGLEKSSLLRGARALVLENINGFTQNSFMRGSPSLMNVKFTAPYGLSGDFADLQSFAANAVRQHFTRSLNRIEGVDFRVPISDELDAMAAFQNSLTLPANENFDEANRFERFLTNDTQRRGRDFFLGVSRCSVCHGGKTLSHSDGQFGTTAGINESFNTGIAQRAINGGLPTEQAIGQPANTRRFNVPSLIGLTRTAPFFHENSSPDLGSAIIFYDTGDFASSPAGTQLGGTLTVNTSDIAAFLQAVGEEPSGSPSINGTRSSDIVNDNASIAPFATVTIDDPDTPAQTLIVTVSMDAAAKGRFASLNGFAMTGAGQARFVGTDAEATAAIRGLVFEPTRGRLPLNARETVRFTISINDSIVTPTISDATQVTVRSVGFLHPSATDAWDLATGTIITGSSGFEALSDARDMLGGVFATSNPGTAIFADGKPAGFIHAIEWQTPSPITLQAVRLFAQGDGSNAREFASFVLKTKSSPTSGFDIQLLSYIPSHPYTFEDAVTSALFSASLTPTTGQFFRAEFEQFGSLAPRIIELDGFESVPCTPAPSGMVAFWPGDMHAHDLISGLNGTEVGTLFYDDAKVSSGFGFDGAGEINVPHDNKLNLQTFTLEAWVFPTSLDGGNDMILCKEDTTGIQYELSIKGPVVSVPNNIPIGNLAYFIGGIQGLPNDYGGWVNGGGPVPLFEWSHVVLTFDGTTVRTYINGVQARSVSGLSGQVTSTTGSLKIGARRPDLLVANPNERFNGLIDEVGIYNRALTLEEIDTIFSTDTVGKCKSTIAGRFIFYNNSKFNGNNAAATELDDNAIPSNKAALLPGGTATFLNYTSYSRGINGVMVDVAYIGGTLSSDDFIFRVGNDNSPAGWATAPSPTSIAVRPGAGMFGSDRITLIWDDGVIKKQWLQVTVKSTPNTGLLKDDIFYFGNAIGDCGNSSIDTKVNATDEILARNNIRSMGQAPITFPYDYNRDSKVNATDEIIARNNPTSSVTALKLITVP